jgi:hypothetical protein
MLTFGGPNVTFLAHDVTLGGIVIDGDGSIDGLMEEDTWHGTLALDGLMHHLGRPNVTHFILNVTFLELNVTFLELNVTPLGHDVTLLGFYLM